MNAYPQDTTAPLLLPPQPTLFRIVNSTICDGQTCLRLISTNHIFPSLSVVHSIFFSLISLSHSHSRLASLPAPHPLRLPRCCTFLPHTDYRWMQIVSSSKTMSSVGANLNKKFLAMITILCSSIGILFLALGLLGLTFITSALGAVCFLAVVIMYFIGSFQLLKLTGKTNRMAIAVAFLTRQIACSLGIAILCTVSCKIVLLTDQSVLIRVRTTQDSIHMCCYSCVYATHSLSPSPPNTRPRITAPPVTVISPMIDVTPFAMMPVGMMIANFVMPMSFGAGHIFLLRFLSDTLMGRGKKRAQSKISASGIAGPQSTAKSTNVQTGGTGATATGATGATGVTGGTTHGDTTTGNTTMGNNDDDDDDKAATDEVAVAVVTPGRESVA